ncbi:hypothetical protein BKA63DRAFT_580947, partial [Paraphoma chrysanthemicola]
PSIPWTCLPSATTVTFAHEFIADYFRSASKAFPTMGPTPTIFLDIYAAESHLLIACLEAFVNPGDGSVLGVSKSLQHYAKHHFYIHLRNVIATPGVNTTVNTAECELSFMRIAHLLYEFFTNDTVIRAWVHELPWTFFDRPMIDGLAQCTAVLYSIASDYLPFSTKSWLASCQQHPRDLLVPVARVCAEECFHGEWLPLETLRVAAQIRALAEAPDSGDMLPEELSYETIADVVQWSNIEQNASWNRKLGICLRNSGHVKESIEYFERAIELDQNFTEARGGLARHTKSLGILTRPLNWNS